MCEAALDDKVAPANKADESARCFGVTGHGCLRAGGAVLSVRRGQVACQSGDVGVLVQVCAVVGGSRPSQGRAWIPGSSGVMIMFARLFDKMLFFS